MHKITTIHTWMAYLHMVYLRYTSIYIELFTVMLYFIGIVYKKTLFQVGFTKEPFHGLLQHHS